VFTTEQIFVKDNQMEERIKFLSKAIEKRFFYKEFISLEETLFLSKEMESKIHLLIIDPKMLVEQFHGKIFGYLYVRFLSENNVSETIIKCAVQPLSNDEKNSLWSYRNFPIETTEIDYSQELKEYLISLKDNFKRIEIKTK